VAVPVWTVGEILTASDVNSWFVPIAAYKTSATSLSTTTLTNDPDLTVALAASATYEVRAMIGYTNASGSSAFHYTFTLPTGASGAYGGTYTKPGPLVGPWFNNWTAVVDAAASDNLGHGLVLGGTVFMGVNAGSLQLQWCCTTASSGSLAVGIGSNLVARRVG
jgi:hypothetical protein